MMVVVMVVVVVAVVEQAKGCPPPGHKLVSSLKLSACALTENHF